MVRNQHEQSAKTQCQWENYKDSPKIRHGQSSKQLTCTTHKHQPKSWVPHSPVLRLASLDSVSTLLCAVCVSAFKPLFSFVCHAPSIRKLLRLSFGTSTIS